MAMAIQNTRDRRNEIGVLRALGYGSGKLPCCFGKSIMIGALGALIGFATGSWIAVSYGPEIFRATSKDLQVEYHLLMWSMILAPLFAALAGFIPAMIAVTQDPAETLRDV